MSHCKSCGADVFYVRSEHGRNLILNAAPALCGALAPFGAGAGRFSGLLRWPTCGKCRTAAEVMGPHPTQADDAPPPSLGVELAMTAVAVPMLPFADVDQLVRVQRVDIGSRLLADRHYSRQTVGAREFMGNGRCLVLRNTAGTVAFGWIYPPDGRAVVDAAYCSIFRNESSRLSSGIILEAEAMALAKWPELPRFATYVNPRKVASKNPGYCFKVAGYRHVGNSTRGCHLLVKERTG